MSTFLSKNELKASIIATLLHSLLFLTTRLDWSLQFYVVVDLNGFLLIGEGGMS